MQFPLSGLLGTLTRWRVRPAGRTIKKAPKFGADGFEDRTKNRGLGYPRDHHQVKLGSGAGPV
jgi:hypothetical protein